MRMWLVPTPRRRRGVAGASWTAVTPIAHVARTHTSFTAISRRRFLSDPPPRWPVPRPAPGREAWAAAAPIVRTGTREPAEAGPRMYTTQFIERKVEERSSPLRRIVIRVSPYSPLCGSAFPGYAPSKALLSHPCGEVCVSYGFLWHWLTGPMCCYRQIRN